MAKHLEKFTRPFQNSAIPFVLAEVLTNGQGQMVDLVCRFLNPAAAALLQVAPEAVQGRRLSQLSPLPALEDLSPVQAVAFSGSSASFSCETAGGQALSVTCYQVMYGVVGCLLDPCRESAASGVPALPEAVPAAVLELDRSGLRCVACNRMLGQLTGWTQKSLLNRGADGFAALTVPEDWPALLQALLDAAREKRDADQDLRLLRRDGGPIWVNLRAELLSSRQGRTVFRGIFTDIDRLRQRETALRESLARQEAARRQAVDLLERVPVGLCLLRRRPDGGTEVVRVNQALCQLLALSSDALADRLAEDPGGFLQADQREELLADAVRARECRLPLRRVCRIVSGEGRICALSVHAVWDPQPDGSWLVSIACSDVSQEAAADREHRIRAQLCDLLLEHTSLLTLDYDPAADLAQIQRHSPGGRRTSRTISGYLKSLSTAPYLHPEDRRRMAGAIRRALTRPGTISGSYRADYDGNGWRQYQVSWMSLFDERGDVRRLLGKAEDVTSRRAVAEHFRQLAARHRKQAKACLASARLDLTADQTLDAKAASRHLLRSLFDRTAAACLQRMAAALPDPEERARFDARFSPSALGEAFTQGCFQCSLAHRLSTGKGGIRWVLTTVEVAENPDSLHLEAFFQLQDQSPLRLREALLEALIQQEGRLILTVDAATGGCRAHGPAAEHLPEDATCRSLSVWYLRQLPPTPERAALRKALTLKQVLARLETAPAVELELPAPGGRPLQLRCSRLEGMSDVLLVLLNGL